MKTSQWFLLLFSALSLASAFMTMNDGAMPVLFLLVALIASTCAQSYHDIHKRIDQIERRDDKGPK
jgi:low affinity Fe/Cu permease